LKDPDEKQEIKTNDSLSLELDNTKENPIIEYKV
jgi:hypothetical protein